MNVSSSVLLVVFLLLVVGNRIAFHKIYGSVVGASEIASSSAAPVVPLRLCIDLSLFRDGAQGGKVIIAILC